ncbi:MAG: DUF465 domain-containing protein [Thermodesulfobacteriota bacterium]
MEKREAGLIEKLARENEEFKKLLEEHHNLKKDLKEYEKKVYLTPTQLMQKSKLKKLKLVGKDRMEAILREYHPKS